MGLDKRAPEPEPVTPGPASISTIGKTLATIGVGHQQGQTLKIENYKLSQKATCNSQFSILILQFLI
jgi:hypothetical protein